MQRKLVSRERKVLLQFATGKNRLVDIAAGSQEKMMLNQGRVTNCEKFKPLSWAIRRSYFSCSNLDRGWARSNSFHLVSNQPVTMLQSEHEQETVTILTENTPHPHSAHGDGGWGPLVGYVSEEPREETQLEFGFRLEEHSKLVISLDLGVVQGCQVAL